MESLPNYEFGRYQLDPGQKILLRDGARVPLNPKTFQMLLVLVEAEGRVVSKDELMAKVWPDAVVEESNLTKNISLLRKALGNDSESAEFIETIPKIGYRFVARTLQRLNSDGELPPASNHQASNLLPSAIRPRGRRRFGLYLVTGLILIAATTLTLRWVKWPETRNPKSPFAQMQIRRLTSSNNAFEAAISPNGKLVSYILGNAGSQSLWLKDLAAGKETQLIAPALVRYRGLAFSRDGNFIYYSRRQLSESVFVLYQIPITGETPVKLLSGVDSAVTVSPDGRQLAFVREDETTRESALMISKSDGTAERKLAVCITPNSFSLDGPSWSPDGKLVAIAKMIPSPDFHFRLTAVRVTDGVEQSIGEIKWAWMMRVAWLAEGSELVVVGRLRWKGTNTQLWHISYPRGELQRITNDLDDYRNLSLTTDKLVTVQSEVRSDIWVVQPDNPDKAIQITNAPTDRNGLGLDWTQDGRIVYTSDAGGHQNLWIMGANGSQRRQLTPDSDDHDISPVISSNDGYIVFHSSRSGASRIWRINTDGSNLTELSRGTHDSRPQYSPNGNWIVYSAEHSEKKSQRVVMKIPATDGASEPVPLADKFTDYPVVSPDSRWIACAYREETASPLKIALLPIAGGSLVRLLDIPCFPWPTVRWHPNGRALCYLDPKDNSSNVWLFPLDGGNPEKLTDFRGERIFEYAWSRDGRSLACARGTENRDVVLIEGIKPTKD